MPAIRASHPGKAFFQICTSQISANNFADNRPEKSIPLFEFLRVVSFKVLIMSGEYLPKGDAFGSLG